MLNKLKNKFNMMMKYYKVIMHILDHIEDI